MRIHVFRWLHISQQAQNNYRKIGTNIFNATQVSLNKSKIANQDDSDYSHSLSDSSSSGGSNSPIVE